MKLICAWCHKVIRESPEAPDLISHGICKACKEKEMPHAEQLRMAIPGESPEEIKVGNQAATEKSASGRLKHQSSAIPNLPKEAPKKSRGHPSMAGEPSSPDGSAKRLRENKNNEHPGVAILCTIPGVNQARAMAILEHFGSVRAFDQAILKERMQVPGIGRTLAKRFDQVMELPYRKGAKHEDV